MSKTVRTILIVVAVVVVLAVVGVIIYHASMPKDASGKMVAEATSFISSSGYLSLR